jgi:apolipoprotein N-acyltransferase
MKKNIVYLLISICCFGVFYGYIYNHFWPLIILGFAIYFYILSNSINEKKTMYFRAFVFGCLLYGLIYYWVMFPILHFSNSLIITIIAFIIFLLIFGQIPLLATVIAYNTGKKETLLLRLILLWVLIEWLQTTHSIFFPWAIIGYGMTLSPIASFAPYGGVFLVSGLTLLTSLLLCNIFLNKKTIKNINLILLIMAVGFILNKAPKWTIKHSNIKIKWLNSLEDENKWRRKNIDSLLKKSTTKFKNDLIIWPEGELAWIFDKNQLQKEKIINWVKKFKTPILTGTFNLHKNNLYNSALLISPKSLQWVYKQQLVPFGEYTPFANLFMPLLEKLNIPMSNLKPSYNDHSINLKQNNLIVLICYEIAFPSLVWSNSKHNQAIIAITDDHWFNSSIAIQEHLNMLKMRVLETQKEAAFINHNGQNQIIHLKPDTSYYANKLFLRTGSTPITKYSELPIIILIVVLLTTLFLKEKTTKG